MCCDRHLSPAASSQSLAAPAGQDFSTDSGEERTATSTASVRGTAATFTDGKRGVAAAVTLRQAWEMSGDVHCLGTKVTLEMLCGVLCGCRGGVASFPGSTDQRFV